MFHPELLMLKPFHVFVRHVFHFELSIYVLSVAA